MGIEPEQVGHENSTVQSTRKREGARSRQKPISPLSQPNSSISIKIRESSPNGTHRTTYQISSEGVDTTSVTPTQPSSSSSTNASASLAIRLLTPFLPTNYPHSVTADYTPYQIYDSLQAFASSIASLLASRAVLTSLGVGSSENDNAASTATATAATLLSIVQNSIGQFATIFFAHVFARRIEGEVKFFRFFADIVNDAAMVLDVLSPSLGVYARVPVLCAASACRAVCGVCGGSSKAILSAHFARAGNIGELNAKDGSQETVVSLVGMWVGGIVVSRVEGRKTTWAWMLILLAMHLWTNWMAVRSVRLKTLNRGRAGIVLGRLLAGRSDISIEDVGRAEKLFERGNAINLSGSTSGYCTFGTVRSLVSCFGGNGPAPGEGANMWNRLLETFADEEYLLWSDQPSRHCIIVLKDGSNGETQLKAWCHGLRVTREARNTMVSTDTSFNLLRRTLLDNSKSWPEWRSQLQATGWDIAASDLAISSGSRLQLHVD